ncbi:phage tail tape measure protein [Variovorax sp.]|uniref:phage tail tape measure protein n=1 Tax=Variovorax sp. TaxID=1871043 RepID=UPI003BA8C200
MTASAGSLVVKLGLDAAEYTQGLTKSEYQARQFGEKIGTAIRDGAALAVASLATIGTGAVAAFAAFDSLVKKAGDFQDLAEKTGASAEGLASFGTAAGTAGTTVDAVAEASIKLTKNLTGVDDESKAAGAAVKALGLDLKDFKSLSPEDQISAASKALAGFADGAGKTAVATALFGKSGAELLPFLKALDEQGGRHVILTQQQIDQADEYADKQAKAQAELQQYAQALATQALPAVTAFTGALTDTIKEMLGVGKGADALKNSTAIADFAENAVSALGFVLDAADGVARVFRVVGTSIGGAAAAAAAAASGEFSQAKTIMGSIGEEVDNILLPETFGAKLKARIEATKKAVAAAAAVGDTAQAKPNIKFNGAVGKGGKDASAQEAKAQLAADLDAIKNAQAAVVSSYSNQEKILSALRSAGLTEDSEYYAEKKRLLDLTTAAQESASQQAIARLQQEKLTGKDAIDNARKIADEEAKLKKVREDAATQAKVYGIESEAANKRIASSLLSARQAAQDFFDTTNQGYARAIDGAGQGSKARDFAAGITQIEDKYRQQRQALQNQRSQAELMGSFGPDAQRQYDAQLAIINEFQGKAIASYQTTYSTLDALSKNWQTGASEALANYATEAQNTAKLTEQAFGSAFKGAEDAIVNFVKTGKLDFKSLADSIIGDIARIFIKQQITGPLAGLLGGLFSPTATAGSGITSIVGMPGPIWGKAVGGPVSAGSMYRVNENGPELLDVNGKQYLMMGNANGRITPNSEVGGGSVVNNFTVGDVATVGMLKQALAASQAQSAQALSRSQRYGGAFAG